MDIGGLVNGLANHATKYFPRVGEYAMYAGKVMLIGTVAGALLVEAACINPAEQPMIAQEQTQISTPKPSPTYYTPALTQTPEPTAPTSTPRSNKFERFGFGDLYYVTESYDKPFRVNKKCLEEAVRKFNSDNRIIRPYNLEPLTEPIPIGGNMDDMKDAEHVMLSGLSWYHNIPFDEEEIFGVGLRCREKSSYFHDNHFDRNINAQEMIHPERFTVNGAPKNAPRRIMMAGARC